MRTPLRSIVLLPTLLAGSACAAGATVPQQCPADYQRPVPPETPAGCDPAAYVADGKTACLTEAYMTSVISDPAPSVEAQLLWQNLSSGFYDNGSEVMAAFARTYLKELPEPSEAELTTLRMQTRANLVAVEGGTFQMGDFGPLLENGGVFTGTEDDVVHPVKLSDFSILRHRVTFADFDLYTRATNAEPLVDSASIGARFKHYYANAVTWDQAHSYCRWLGEQIGRPLDLPTEAQWEYAARAGGQLLTVGTTLPKEQVHRETLNSYSSCRSVTSSATPLATFPPNALGLYEMVGTGDEWVRDWYGADYYASFGGEVAVDPTGPDSGTERVVRNGSRHRYALTITREHYLPERQGESVGFGFRCATPP